MSGGEQRVEPTGSGPIVDVGLMGEQLQAAGETVLAAAWYERAGRQAQTMWQTGAAIDYFMRALALLPLGDEYAARVMDIQEGLAAMLFAQSHYDEAAAAYTAMGEAAEMAGDRQDRAHALNGRSMALSEQGEYEAALESAREAEGLARAAGAQHELAAALQRQGRARLGLGDKRAAARLAQEALAYNSTLTAWDEAGHCFSLLAKAQGRNEAARPFVTSAITAYRVVGNKWGMMMMYCYLGDIERESGSSEPATEYDEALRIAHEIGNLRVEQMITSEGTSEMNKVT